MCDLLSHLRPQAEIPEAGHAQCEKPPTLSAVAGAVQACHSLETRRRTPNVRGESRIGNTKHLDLVAQYFLPEWTYMNRMELLLSKLGNQAINLVLRSGIALTSSYAQQQCSRLLKTVNDKAIHTELRALQKILDSKVKVGVDFQLISPTPTSDTLY